MKETNTSESIHVQKAYLQSISNDKEREQKIKEARDKCLKQAASDRARKLYERNFETSKLPDRSRNLPQFSLDELNQGPVLGKGAFATVYEVRGFEIEATLCCQPKQLNPLASGSSRSSLLDDNSALDPKVGKGETESRGFMICNSFRNSGDTRYAVKRLSSDLEKKYHVQAMSDLAGETRILANLHHPNIIQLRAIAGEPRFEMDFFIVLDRLYDRLDKRMEFWAMEMKKVSGLSGKLLHDRTGHKRAALYHERVEAAYHLSSALWYLHNNRIIHRDLKPENISFDLNGSLKLFDFGLSTELPSSTGADEHGLYHLTSKTGSPRYMAPEVALGQGYNESCDIYSFAILLWEILALKKAFGSYSMNGLYQNVFTMPHKRPLINPKWHTTLKKLLHYAWSPMIEDRPKMCVFKSILKEESTEFRNYETEHLNVNQNESRSTYMYDKAKEALRKNTKAGHCHHHHHLGAGVDDSNYVFEERGFWKSVATTE